MTVIDPLSPDFTYAQVANSMAARINAGEFRHRLPAQRDLAEEYQVAYQTVRHALAMLRETGLVATRQGLGTYVTARTEMTYRGRHRRPERKPSRP